MAAFDVLAGVALVGVAVWLVAGLSFAVNEAERVLRLRSAGVVAPLAGALLALGWALFRRARAARRLQRWLAFAVLPLLPVGTAWGLYILRVLDQPSEPEVQQERSPQARPFWSLLAMGTAVGIAALSFGVLKTREFWLERQVDRATEAVARQQESVSKRIEELRDNGVVDTGSSAPPPRVRR